MNGMNHMSLNPWQITKDAYYGSGPSLKRLHLSVGVKIFYMDGNSFGRLGTFVG